MVQRRMGFPNNLRKCIEWIFVFIAILGIAIDSLTIPGEIEVN